LTKKGIGRILFILVGLFQLAWVITVIEQRMFSFIPFIC